MIKSPAICVVITSALGGISMPISAEVAGMDWDEPIEIASGDAHQGPWRMNESEFLYVDDAGVAMNNTGRIAIVWANNAEQDIYFQSVTADGDRLPTEPVNVSRSPDTFSWLPRVAISNDANEVYILWQEIVFSGGSHGGEIFFARSTDGGNSFSKPRNLSNTTAGAGKGRLDQRRWHNGSLDLALDNKGNLYTVWTEYEGKLWFSRSTDGGQNFSTPLHIAGDDTTPARGPSLAVHDSDNIYLAWTVGEDRAANIHFAQSADAGESFSQPVTVQDSQGHADAPKLAIDSTGVIHLVYGESEKGPWQNYHIRYSRSTDGGETFEQSRDISQPLTEDFFATNFPALAVDGDDNVYVLWELFPERHIRSLGLGFTHSGDNGDSFTTPEAIPGSTDPSLGINGSLQGLLMNKLAVNEQGQIAIVNSTFYPDRSSHIWLYHGRPDGH